MSWQILKNTQVFLKTFFIFCPSEQVKVLIDGQMNTFLEK